MDKKELKALRRPFLKELFKKNKFKIFITTFVLLKLILFYSFNKQLLLI